MTKNKNFVLSGILAVGFYLFVVITSLILISSSKVETYKFKSKTTVLELEVIEQVDKKTQVEKKNTVIKPKEIKEPIKETSRSNEKTPDLKSLFGNVKTKAIRTPEKVVNNVRKSIDPKRFKSKFEKEKKTSNVNIDKLLTDVKTTTTIKKINNTSNTEEETDEYYSKINELLSAWTPNVNAGGLVANVIVTINTKGKFNYRFVKYSSDDTFNNSLESFLNEQLNQPYPVPKNGSSVSISVDFKSER